MKNVWLLSFVVLTALKLTGCIDWSWWWILAVPTARSVVFAIDRLAWYCGKNSEEG